MLRFCLDVNETTEILPILYGDRVKFSYSCIGKFLPKEKP